MFDLKIIGGTIIDGTSNRRYSGDIGINGEFITEIGDLKNAPALETIDATGKYVAPGFIDMHTHSDVSLLVNHHASSKIYDGVTTEVIANCGIGVAPVSDARKPDLINYLGTRLIGSIPIKIELPWNTMDEYFDAVDKSAPAVNVAPLLAQGPIRINEMSFAKEHPDREQMERMKADVVRAMDAGCLGISSGLVYMPGEYTTPEELGELCSVLKPYKGYYTTHMRNEGNDIWNAINEAVKIAKIGGVGLHISHLKLMGSEVRGQHERLLGLLENLRSEGLEVTWDAYPYTAGCTSLGACMPPWAFEGGVNSLMERLTKQEMRDKIRYDIENGIPGWENFCQAAHGWDNIPIATVNTADSQKYLGMMIGDAARMEGKDSYDFVFDFMIKEQGRVQIITNGAMIEEDVTAIMSHPDTMIGSDGMALSTEGVLAAGKPHPRAFGTRARFLSRYVRNFGTDSLENAVARLTSKAAKRLNLDRRGLLQKGYYADITVFDYEQVKDNATYQNPHQYSTGFSAVIVNGKPALKDGVQTENFTGRVLRGGK